MKPFLVFVLCLISQVALPSQQAPTREELRQTLVHMMQISGQQQRDLESQKSQLATTQQNLNDAKNVEIPKLQKQISDQATELAKDKVIVDQVSTVGGAFSYAFHLLFKHLLIAVAVLAVAAIAVLVLSFFFPFIIPALRAVGNVFARVFTMIGNIFKKG